MFSTEGFGLLLVLLPVGLLSFFVFLLGWLGWLELRPRETFIGGALFELAEPFFFDGGEGSWFFLRPPGSLKSLGWM